MNRCPYCDRDMGTNNTSHWAECIAAPSFVVGDARRAIDAHGAAFFEQPTRRTDEDPATRRGRRSGTPTDDPRAGESAARPAAKPRRGDEPRRGPTKREAERQRVESLPDWVD